MQLPHPTTTNTHPMTTRSKNGIFELKALAAKVASAQSPSVVNSTKLAKPTSISKPDYTLTEPPSFKIVAQFPQWCKAMDKEFVALQRQGTWSLVPPFSTQNVVGCKWVFKLKHNSDGSINRYKARLVAKGFHQQ